MAKEWNDDEVKGEIAEAVRIVREDKFEAFVRGRQSSQPNDQGNPNNAPANQPPPPNGAPGSTPKKKGIFWGVEE